jgi:hypothetical protein
MTLGKMPGRKPIQFIYVFYRPYPFAPECAYAYHPVGNL